MCIIFGALTHHSTPLRLPLITTHHISRWRFDDQLASTRRINSLSPSLLSLSLSSLSPLHESTNLPRNIEEKYDTSSDEEEKEEKDGKENDDPLSTLAFAASSSHHHHGPRGKYGKHVDNDTRITIVSLRTEKELSPHDIQVNIREKTGQEINIQTIRRILHQQLTGKDYLLQTHRSKRKSFTEEQEEAVRTMQDEHNEWRYKDIRAEFEKRFNKKISDGKINTILKEGKFSEKNLQQVPAERNSPENIEKRKQYSLRARNWAKKDLIFIDESGFTKHIVCRRGRSRVGKIAKQIQKTSKGTRMNVCAAISPFFGMVHYEVITSTWDQHQFAGFLTRLLAQPILQTKSFILIMDNVGWHHTELIKSTLEGNNIEHTLELLPPYSPHLNSIEYAFSQWKKGIGEELKDHPHSNLPRLIDELRVKITADYVMRCTEHVYRWYELCKEGRPLEDPLPEEPWEPLPAAQEQ